MFGTEVEVLQGESGWEVFYLGEGMKRPARDIVIPAQTREAELALYLADIRHEYASPKYPEVTRVG